jgi:uncharacterized protein YyaL (SSP411 family)
MRTVAITVFILLAWASPGRGAPKPVPTSPYLPIVYRYADTMLKNGRDATGAQKTGLFLSALDRATLSPLADQPIADPRRDQNLLRVLYALGELSGKPVYRDAADAELKWLLTSAAASAASADGLAPWDTGIAWNVNTGAPVAVGKHDTSGPSRAWMLWDRCFELAPEASGQRVLALDQAAERTAPSPQYAGYAIRAFAVAYQHTQDPKFLKAIESALARLEANREPSSAAAWLSTAIDCAGAAHRVPHDLATRLRALAARRDEAFCALAHDLAGKGGFMLSDDAFTPLWRTPADGRTTARVAMMCVGRYENGGSLKYREMIRTAADAYRRAPPPDGDDVWPMTFGHAISLQLAAWRSTSDQAYLDHARKLADVALARFWSDGPLPRSAASAALYDTATGADTLALALVELHLSILHITAVRPPPNTIDR